MPNWPTDARPRAHAARIQLAPPHLRAALQRPRLLACRHPDSHHLLPLVRRSLLLRMQQSGLQPDEQSFAAVIRAGAGTPGSSQLAKALRPQLEAAVSRRGTQEATRGLSPRSTGALVWASSTDRALFDAAGTPGLRSLQQLLAQGAQLDARAFLNALSGCAKQSGRSGEALQLVGMMEVWVHQQHSTRVRQPEIGQAYAAAIAACDESCDKEAALELLPRMKTLGVGAPAEAYHAAITACRHDGADVRTARALVAQMRQEKLTLTTRSYNCLLQVVSAAGESGDEAFAVLDELERQGLAPDEITYLHLLTACRPTAAQAKSLKSLAWHQRRLAAASSPGPSTFDGALLASSHASELKPAVSLGLGGSRGSSSVSSMRPGSAPPWQRALALMPGMLQRGVVPTERTYAAAIELCARSSEVAEAFRLLYSMPAAGLRPDGYSIVSAATAAAAFGEYPIVLQLLHEVELEAARRRVIAHGRDGLTTDAPACPPRLRSELRLGLFDGGRGDGMGAPLDMNARTRLHHAALLACSIANAPLPQTLALIALMPERGLLHKPHAINFGLQACVANRAWREAAHVLSVAREANVRVRGEDYGKALHAYGAANPPPPWSATVRLLDEIAEQGVVLPRRALLHTLKAGVAAGVGWQAVRHLESFEFEGGAHIASDGELVAMEAQGDVTPSTTDGSLARAAPSLAALVQGEILCLAAQDGLEQDRLPVLIWRLRKADQAPTGRLLERALHACSQSRKEGWRNVPTLLELARIERVRLSERAFVSAIEAHAPLDVYRHAPHSQQHSEQLDFSARLRELAALLGVDQLTPQTLRRVETLCSSSPDACAHVLRLLTTLRPRNAIHDVVPAVQQAAAARRAAHCGPVPGVPTAIVASEGASLGVSARELPAGSKKTSSLEIVELIALLAKQSHEQHTSRTLSRRPGSPQTGL